MQVTLRSMLRAVVPAVKCLYVYMLWAFCIICTVMVLTVVRDSCACSFGVCEAILYWFGGSAGDQSAYALIAKWFDLFISWNLQPIGAQ